MLRHQCVMLGNGGRVWDGILTGQAVEDTLIKHTDFGANRLKLLVTGPSTKTGPWGEVVTSLKINGWNIFMEVWKMIFLYKWPIFRFHVNLPGGCWVLIAYYNNGLQPSTT